MVERDLVASAKAGDRAAFEELVSQTHRQVYTLALRLVGDRAEAEDVAQEAYLRMFRGLAGFREEARFETWMYRIVANCAVSALRARGRFGEVLAGEEELDLPAPHRTEQQAVDSDQLSRALSELPEGQRVVVILKDVYGLSCREIGEELDVEEGAVKVRLHRARKRLVELISEDDRGAEV